MRKGRFVRGVRAAAVWAALLCSVCVADSGMLSPRQEAVLRAIARGESLPWPEMTPAQARAVHEKAERYLENYETHHLPQGMNADILYTDRDRSAVFMYEGLGDGTIWTGHYLAALALKHHVTRDAAALRRIGETLDVFEKLCLMTERKGFIPRYAGGADDPAYAEYYRRYGNWDDPVLPEIGKQAHRGVGPYADQVWLDNSTRDTYDGFLFGLAMTRVFVDDPGVRARVDEIGWLAAKRLIKDKFWIGDGQGHVKNPVPIFTCAWTRLAMSVNPAAGALTESGGLLSCHMPDLRMSTHAEAYRRTLPLCVIAEGHTTGKWEYKYSSNNLTFILCAAAAMLEDQPYEKALLRGMVATLYEASAHDHLNAHFAAIHLMVRGNPRHNDARATLQGQLIDFPEDKWRRYVDRRGDPSIVWHNEKQSEYALLARERIPEDFLWQRTPCACVGGWDMPYEYPGIDMFLPYWMGRAAGAIPAPPEAGTG